MFLLARNTTMISIVETIFELIGASKTGLNVIPHGMNHL